MTTNKKIKSFSFTRDMNIQEIYSWFHPNNIYAYVTPETTYNITYDDDSTDSYSNREPTRFVGKIGEFGH